MAAGEMGRQLGVRAERAEMLIGYRKEKNRRRYDIGSARQWWEFDLGCHQDWAKRINSNQFWALLELSFLSYILKLIFRSVFWALLEML